MRSIYFASLLIVVSAAASSEAMACRSPPEPSEMRDVKADAIILAEITDVKITGEIWRPFVATATRRETVLGSVDTNEFEFAGEGPGSCGHTTPPKLGKLWILYLKKSETGFAVRQAQQYWWARASGDPRLTRHNSLMPLGAVRQPTSEENRLLDFAEARMHLSQGVENLSNYTRVYSRASAGVVVGLILRSRTPRRLITDYTEELPTPETCHCKIHRDVVDLQDLWEAGKLPPFNP